MTTPQDPFSSPPPGGTPPPPPPPQGPPSYGAPTGYGGAPAPGFGGPAPYGSGPAYGAPVAQGNNNGLGTAALVLGIIAILTSWLIFGALPGLIAVILGFVGLGRVKRREASNRGSAIAGIVLGILSLLVMGGVIAAGAAFFNSDTGKALTECLQRAGQDPAAQQQCRREAEERLQR